MLVEISGCGGLQMVVYSAPNQIQVTDAIYLHGQFTKQLFVVPDEQACGHDQ